MKHKKPGDPDFNWTEELRRRTEEQHPGYLEISMCKPGEEFEWSPEHQKRVDEYWAKWTEENNGPNTEFDDKIIRFENLGEWRKKITRTTSPASSHFNSIPKEVAVQLVVTNGCFDIVHLGHISYLKEARKFGSRLLVGINDDKSVKQLKGPSRPINNEKDRALFLAAFPFVDAVCIFPGKRATKFLDLAKPKVYVKGGDYDISSMYIGERKVLEKHKTEIKFAKFVENKSTSSIIEKL